MLRRHIGSAHLAPIAGLSGAIGSALPSGMRRSLAAGIIGGAAAAAVVLELQLVPARLVRDVRALAVTVDRALGHGGQSEANSRELLTSCGLLLLQGKFRLP